MIHLRTYESWFTNIFKSEDNFDYDTRDAISNLISKNKGINPLINAAMDGNWKRFKFLLPRYKNQINDVHIMYLDDGTEAKENVLTCALFGDGDLWEKKKMVSTLIKNGVDVFFKDEGGKNFYERLMRNIENPYYVNKKKMNVYKKLKEWLDQEYPDMIEKLEIASDANKYNL